MQMILVLDRNDDTGQPSIDAAIAAHGAWRVLVVAVAALLRGRLRRARPPDLADLGNHMRADIGLPRQRPAPDWQRLGLAAVRMR